MSGDYQPAFGRNKIIKKGEKFESLSFELIKSLQLKTQNLKLKTISYSPLSNSLALRASNQGGINSQAAINPRATNVN